MKEKSRSQERMLVTPAKQYGACLQFPNTGAGFMIQIQAIYRTTILISASPGFD